MNQGVRWILATFYEFEKSFAKETLEILLNKMPPLPQIEQELNRIGGRKSQQLIDSCPVTTPVSARKTAPRRVTGTSNRNERNERGRRSPLKRNREDESSPETVDVVNSQENGTRLINISDEVAPNNTSHMSRDLFPETNVWVTNIVMDNDAVPRPKQRVKHLQTRK